MAILPTRPPEQRVEHGVYEPRDAVLTPEMSVTLANKLGNNVGSGGPMSEAEMMCCLRFYQRLQIEAVKGGPEWSVCNRMAQSRIDQAVRRIRALRDARESEGVRHRDDDLLSIQD